MTTVDDVLAPGDFDRLAALHVLCLPESMLSRLGRRYLTAAYRYFDRSALEHICLHRIDHRIDSACVLSLSPDTMTRRLASRTSLLLWLSLHLLEPRVLRAILDSSGGPSFNCPEVVFVFSDPASRGLGQGGALLAQCEALLRDKGITRYAIKTVDDDANRAIRFYLRHGFKERGRFVQHSTRFRWMDKTL